MQAGNHRVINPNGDGEQGAHKHPRVGRHEIEADPQQQTGARVGVQAVEEVAEEFRHSIFLYHLLP